MVLPQCVYAYVWSVHLILQNANRNLASYKYKVFHLYGFFGELLDESFLCKLFRSLRGYICGYASFPGQGYFFGYIWVYRALTRSLLLDILDSTSSDSYKSAVEENGVMGRHGNRYGPESVGSVL